MTIGKTLLSGLAAIALLLWPLSGLAEGNDMTGVFDFENRRVLLNSGYDMPIVGLGTYALGHDACVNSVMALLENGGRLIDTAYMYGNEEAVGICHAATSNPAFVLCYIASAGGKMPRASQQELVKSRRFKDLLHFITDVQQLETALVLQGFIHHQ